MKKLAAVLIAVTAAGVWITASSAVPPPEVRAAVSHARPVAGHAFVGVIFTAPVPIQHVTIESNYRGFVERFHTPLQPPIVAVAWKLPANARGMLRAVITVETPLAVSAGGANVSWHIH